MQSVFGIEIVGLALILIATGLYVTGHRRWSLLMYVSFLSDGFQVFTDSILGVKNIDMAFIYTLLVLPFSAIYEKRNKQEDGVQRWLVWAMLAFMLCSVAFSYEHYHIHPIQILQGSRYLFLFLGYFFVVKASKKEILWIVNKIYKITVVVSVLYMLEVFFDLPTLPYDMGVARDAAVGLGRYYNSPFYLPLCIYLSIFAPGVLKIRFRMACLVVLIVAQVATLGRVEIAATLLMVLLGILLRGNRSQTVRILLVGTILFVPMAEIIENRFVKSTNSELDVKSVFEGNYKDLSKENISKNGTLTYRFAWVYERWEYLETRPWSEQVFGLGLISDSQFYEVLSRYSFQLGLLDPNTHMPLQMKTPDISYGNLLTMLGRGGGALLLALWVYLAIQGFRHRKEEPFEVVLFLLVTGYLIRSLSGVVVSDPGNLIVPMMLYACYWRKDQLPIPTAEAEPVDAEEETEETETEEKPNEDSSHRVGPGQPDAELLRVAGTAEGEPR